MTPDARRRIAGALMAEQYNRSTPQDTEVIERGGLMPVGTYANGMTGPAIPGFIYDGFMAPGDALSGKFGNYQDNRENWAKAGFDAAGAAMVGGLAARRPRGALAPQVAREVPPQAKSALPNVTQNSLDDLYGAGYEAWMARQNALFDEFSKSSQGARVREPAYHGAADPDIMNPVARKLRSSLTNDGPWGSSSRQVANTYTESREIGTPRGPQDGSLLLPVEYRFNNPMVVDAKGKLWDNLPYLRNDPYDGAWPIDTDTLSNAAKARGHDGLVVRNVKDEMDGSGGEIASTYHALQPGTVYSPLTGELLFANGGKQGAATGAALNAAGERQGIRGYHGTASAIEEFGSPTFWSPSRDVANSYRIDGTSGANISGKAAPLDPGYSTAARYVDKYAGDRNAAIQALREDGKPIAQQSLFDRILGRKPNQTIADSDVWAAQQSTDAINYLTNNQQPGALGRIYSADLPPPQKTYPYATTADRQAAIADAQANGHSVIALDPGNGLPPEIVTFGTNVPQNISAELFANGGRPGAAVGAVSTADIVRALMQEDDATKYRGAI